MIAEEHPLSALSLHAARSLSEMCGGSELVTKVVVALTEALENGGVCVAPGEFGVEEEVLETLSRLPVVGGVGEEKPIIIDNGLIYFHRYHHYESRLASQLLRLARTPSSVPANVPEEQARILSRALGIVTGGPGTGKTTLAAKLLATLAQGSDRPVAAALAAPTGKAAARLAESVGRAVGDDGDRLVLTHGTVHRLLGPRAESAFFRHNAAHPLLFDIVVLDESSMMDLPLMEKLVDAIDPDKTRLLLLGDPDQLPSIYSGSVLADIVEAAEKGGPLGSSFLRLTQNHRSGENPELAALVDAVRSGEASRVLPLFSGGVLSLEKPPSPRDMAEFSARELTPVMNALADARSPKAALEAAAAHRLVCMLRQGPCGAEAVNTLALELAEKLGHSRRGERLHHGLPIIVTRNDHKLNLYNGDSGVILREHGHLFAYFEGEGGPRAVPVQNLPPCEPAYALTVHRGQGSEYGSVTLLLPPEDHPLLTRELLYTGISRARHRVKVAGTPELLRAALSRKERRASGLAKRLGETTAG